MEDIMTSEDAIQSLTEQKNKVDSLKYGQINLIVRDCKVIRIDYYESQLIKK